MTYHIHLTGQVQGVGFRPFVYRLAKEMNLYGWVSNDNDGVHIEVTTFTEIFHQFLNRLLEEAPPLAKITGKIVKIRPEQVFNDFEIRHSSTNSQSNLLLTPDVATCPDCLAELLEPENRRYFYPFITCTNCGVRYSIIESLPYDRENTTMAAFKPCFSCQKEYQDPLNRMYYSQTNSCPDCGVRMRLFVKNKEVFFEDPKEQALNREIIKTVALAWKIGKIVALKGIGGYLLSCDATNAAAIRTLREHKKRPSKPFALMYPNLESIKMDVELSEKAIELLQSPESPIVLLDLQENKTSGIAHWEIAPNLHQIGVMLPYTPLFVLLLREFQKPIVATSANLSNSPIIYEDEKALQDLGEIADLILTHNRPIVAPQDDSVISLAAWDQQPIFLRRSRAFAPNFIPKKEVLKSRSEFNLQTKPKTILAMGAEMKSTFALTHQNNLYISQYLGDLESYETQENYQKLIRHFLKLFHTQPELIVVDQHPRYFSTQLGQELAKEFQIPVKHVQHHFAHFAAVLSENELLDSPEKILGIIWDGTGLGSDQQIWGGEMMIYHQKSFKRIAHLPYFPMIAGDKMPREPRISALCATYGLENASELLRHKFTETEWKIYGQLLQKPTLQTSSIGRLFDALASLLGIVDQASYEGEAAMLLESIARQYLKKTPRFQISFDPAKTHRDFLEELIQDILAKKEVGQIALKFHLYLVKLIENQAKIQKIKKIALSGGVFQNILLVTLIKQSLGGEFQLFFHHQLSPNDENIAFGQIALTSLSGLVDVADFEMRKT
ncbi:MAG: carbamoyltransferase HypF [Microscillaceae bacterium]|nr:carbamoyltransferase HypF [Microscillaceae bacterium]